MYYKSTNHTQGQNISFFQNKVKNLNNIMIIIRRRIKKKRKYIYCYKIILNLVLI